MNMEQESFYDVNIDGYSLLSETGDAIWSDPSMIGMRPTLSTYFSNLFSARCFPFSRDVKGHCSCVNSISFSNGCKEFLASGGDDKNVLIWPSTRLISPEWANSSSDSRYLHSLKGHFSNIFDIKWAPGNRRVASAGNDSLILIHDIDSGREDPSLTLRGHQGAVRRISICSDNENVLFSVSEDEELRIWDLRVGKSTNTISYLTELSCVESNPAQSNFIVIAGNDLLTLADIRQASEPVFEYDHDDTDGCVTSFSSSGDSFAAISELNYPILYRVNEKRPKIEFANEMYLNVTTRKDVAIFGYNGEEYVAAGSDDHRVYVWRIPTDDMSGELEDPFILSGHRSIVNSVQFNEYYHFMASSGPEKIIKIWNPFPQRESDVENSPFRRRNLYPGNRVLFADFLHGDEDTEESIYMLAYFDAIHRADIDLILSNT